MDRLRPNKRYEDISYCTNERLNNDQCLIGMTVFTFIKITPICFSIVSAHTTVLFSELNYEAHLNIINLRQHLYSNQKISKSYTSAAD